jgi:endoglucanase
MASQKAILPSLIVTVVALAVVGILAHKALSKEPASSSSTNPLAGISLYNDRSRQLAELPAELQKANRANDAKLINSISKQPGATWLTGPSDSDDTASRDIAAVKRTSQEAAKQKTVPVYVLYAIPKRDACAQYSKGGFASEEAYMQWLNSIMLAQRTPAIYIIEPDAIPQAVLTSCLTSSERTERYQTLQNASAKLASSRMTQAAYLDAGHLEWAKDPKVLVKPLQEAGVGKVRGISVNVSFFAPTGQSIKWAQNLTHKLGGSKGIVIDTSRNGNGLPPADQTGSSRWCNPTGRAVGDYPSVDTDARNVDAYLWVKNIGESDGDCFGNPPAGKFMPNAVLEFAKNAH